MRVEVVKIFIRDVAQEFSILCILWHFNPFRGARK